MSTEPEFMADALDDLADAQASLEADEMLEAIELAQLNSALDYMRENAPSLAEFEDRFGKINAAHLTCNAESDTLSIQERHALLASWDRGETVRTWITRGRVCSSGPGVQSIPRYKVCCETGRTSCKRVALHNIAPDGDAYRVDPDSPSAKAARRMRKVEGL